MGTVAHRPTGHSRVPSDLDSRNSLGLAQMAHVADRHPQLGAAVGGIDSSTASLRDGRRFFPASDFVASLQISGGLLAVARILDSKPGGPDCRQIARDSYGSSDVCRLQTQADGDSLVSKAARFCDLDSRSCPCRAPCHADLPRCTSQAHRYETGREVVSPQASTPLAELHQAQISKQAVAVASNPANTNR